MSQKYTTNRFNTSLAQSIYREIAARNSRYYYYLGGSTQDDILDINGSEQFESDVRRKMILLKSLNPTDCVMIVPRIDWTEGEVYDMYDDTYGTGVSGVNLIDVGAGYLSTPNVTFTSGIGASFTTTLSGDSVSGINVISEGQYYTPEATVSIEESPTGDNAEVSISVPTVGVNAGKVVLTLVNGGSGYVTEPQITITPNNGSGAEAYAVVDSGSNGHINRVVMTRSGTGYKYPPTLLFTGSSLSGSGRGAVAIAVLTKTLEGKTRLPDAKYYVLTDDMKVYKCIDNNYGSPSTSKPISISAKVFTTSDGYRWKFMYRIPPNIVSKFLTSEHLPVINSLSENFYDLGTIARVGIDSAGSGYSATNTKINVYGDGYQEKNPFMITGCVVTNGGSGYSTSTTVDFDPPISGDYRNYSAPGSITVNLGEYLKHEDRFYLVLKSGTITTDQSVHPALSGTSNIDSNSQIIVDDAVVQFVGERITPQLTTSAGVVTGISLLGRVYSIDVIDGGFGYPSNIVSSVDIDVVVKDGATIVAQGKGIISSGRIQKVVLTYSIKSAAQSSTLTHEVGTIWSAGVYTVGRLINSNGNLYTRDVEGLSSVAPTHTAGSASGWLYVGKAAVVEATMGYGYGYTSAPEYEVNGIGSGLTLRVYGEKTDAKLTPVIENGAIVDVIVSDGGVGYTYADIDVSSGSGSGARLSTNVFVGNINTLEANNLLSQDAGGIHAIKLTCNGMTGTYSGTTYGYNPNLDGIPVTVTGDGYGCIARGIVNPLNLTLSEIVIDAPGKGYTYASVSIPDTTHSLVVGADTLNFLGTGALARAVISPAGGHTRDNISELCASQIMTYIRLGSEKFYGFTLDSQFRFFGLIKNPKSFDGRGYVSTLLASPCYIAYCNYNQSAFTSSSIVKVVKTIVREELNLEETVTARYRIISAVDGALILMDMDNRLLESGDVLQATLGATVFQSEVESVVLPQFDRTSGELLSVDVRDMAFSPNSNQSVVARNILGWS